MATLQEFLASLRGPTPSLEGIEQALPPQGTDTLARTVWGEGRSEGPQGMQAIANTLMNRMGQPGFPSTPEGVALQPQQFSVWNPTDPNFSKLQQVGMDDPNFAKAHELARLALSRQLPDITGGATHYTGPGAKASWPKAMQPTKAVGKHQFYKQPKKKKAAPPVEEEVGPKIETLTSLPEPVYTTRSSNSPSAKE